MLKFRPSNLAQKRPNISFDELQLIALIEKGLSDNSLRGLLYKRSSSSAKWRLKWFLLFENLLFYFDLGSQKQQDQQQQKEQQKEQKEQQQQQHQRQKQQKKHEQASRSPSRSSFSSLIRRNKSHNNSSNQQQQQQEQKRSDISQVSLTPTHRTRNDVLLEPRRASVSDTFTRVGRTSTPITDQQQQRQAQRSQQAGAPLAPPRTRQRLSSDPQNSGASNVLSYSGEGRGFNARSELSLSYHEHSVLNHTNISKTLNSSSISGVSNHFQIHNEQTIGRSTTTTAGKTASTSANYSSLLSRKIGVIFLEGSYCERLVDSAANFIGDSGALQVPTATALAKRCSSSAADLNSDLSQFPNAFQLTNNSKSSRANSLIGSLRSTKQDDEDLELNCIFSLTWKKEGSKAYQFRSETEAECLTWVHAISNARYSILLNDKEQLEQKYLHLSQIIESESTAKWQYSKQCDELSTEIKKLRQEICVLKRQENHSNHMRLVLSKSAAIVETILRQQRRRQQQQQQQQQHQNQAEQPRFNASSSSSPSSYNNKQQQQQTIQLLSGSNNRIASKHQQQATCKQRENLLGPSGIIANENKPIKHDINSSGNSSRNNKNNSNEAGDNKFNKEDTEGDDHDDDALCDLSSSRPNSVAALETTAITEQSNLGANTNNNSLYNLSHNIGPGKHELLLKRTRSMEHEQEEQELAVRRTRRTSHLRQSSTIGFSSVSANASTNSNIRSSNNTDKLIDDNQQRRAAEDALKSLVRSVKRVESSNNRFKKRHCSVDHLVLDDNSKLEGKKIANQQQQSNCLPAYSNNNISDNLLVDSDNNVVIGDGDNFNDGEQLLADADEQALSIELKTVVEALNKGILLSGCLLEVENSEEIRKIKKVQGFFRGWLCRRRWKQIVQEYIKSPHAESMRKRNNLVFKMVECEEEYVEQLTLLISSFLRPIKMAASSQKPALDHDELNSIFLNSETLLFLHQIFLKGLTARMESWPTLVLGDLFNMLLPMLTIYQEYVRNHHFSLQVLAECKQREQFSLILRRLEDKPQLNGRTLETFLTYPMHQIPRYIICLHEILAHTPHNHVERSSLYAAQTKLEELSQQMHDEVSETENIRQNLAIERMIIGGCDILLDVNQVFVRQGILLQVVEQPAKGSKNRSRLAPFASRSSNINLNPVNSGSKFQNDDRFHQFTQQAIFSNSNSANSTGNFVSFPYQKQQQANFPDNQSQAIPTGTATATGTGSAATTSTTTSAATTSSSSSNTATTELIRQCFLFTNHLLLCTRTKDGKLHLLEGIGRISLTEVTLIENPLEFIQQQETIVANIESIPTGIAQQSKVTPTTARASRIEAEQQQQLKGGKKSSFNSISDNHSNAGYSDGVSGNENDDDKQKRASTISIPAKWGQANCNANQQGNSIVNSNNIVGKIRSEKRVSYVEFEDQANNGTSRPCVFSASASASGHFSPLVDDRGLKSSSTTSAWLPQSQSLTTSNQNQNLNQSSNPNLNLVNSNQNHNSTNEHETAAATTTTTTAHLLQELPSPAISNHQQQQQQQALASNSTGHISNNNSGNDEVVCSAFKIDSSSASVSSSPNKQTGSSPSSSRGKIAAYLASKLYNLTNLASGGNVASNCATNSTNNIQSQQQQQHATQLLSTNSMSAPPSPLNKRASGACKRQPLRSTHVCYGLDQLPFYLSKDYGGCDFILFVESTSKPVMSMSSSLANHHSGASLQNQHHHHHQNQHGISHHHHAATNIASSNHHHHSGNVTSGLLSTSAHQNHHHSHHHTSAIGILQSGTASSSSCGSGGGPIIIHLIAPNLQEKAAWMSDISQCIDNVHFNDLFHGSVNDSASVTMNQSVRTDPRLYKDDVDIKFSRALNSCKLPQIRYASKDRLFERLTDLRFLSIDFLNTFLLTYRVFTSAEDVLEALKSVHYNCDRYYQQQQQQQQQQINQQQLGPDSLSAFANSSLSSLNTQQTNISPEKSQRDQSDVKLDTNHLKSQSQAMTGSNTSIDKKRDTQRNSFTSGQIQHHISNQKPIIPPRSPGADLNAKLNAQMDSSKFLLAPNAQHQKRRSTISALTPITGSTSSSLVNLNSCVFKNANPSNTQQHQLNTTSKVLANNKNNQATNSLHRSANDDLNLTLSEDDGDINYNLNDSCDEKQLTNETISPTERIRSSSMTDQSIRPLIITTTTKAKNLDVPICRQIRASSLSHVSDCAQISTTARCESFKNQANHSSPGNEHWRLSYKKMAGELAACDKKSQDIFYGRDNYHLSAGPPTNVTPRRASSSDVNVTFHVTLDPPPNETTKTSDDDQPTINLNNSATPSPSSPMSLSYSSPKVPPSTPIDPSSDNEAEANRSSTHTIISSSQQAKTYCDTNSEALDNNNNHLHKKVTNNKSSEQQHLTVDTKHTYSRQHHHRHHHNHQQQQQQRYETRETLSKKVVATDSSNSSLVVSDDSRSSNSSSTTTSSCSINLNSRSTKPILSSQSESGLIQSSSSLESIDNTDGEHKTLKPKSTKCRRRKIIHSGVNHEFIPPNDQKNLARSCFVLKEIELNETKTIDYDTSADEDKILTSSDGEDNLDNDDEDSDSNLTNEKVINNKGMYDNTHNIDKSEKLIVNAENKVERSEEDDRSFELLSKLNRLEINKNSSDEDVSNSDIESKALIKPKDNEGKETKKRYQLSQNNKRSNEDGHCQRQVMSSKNETQNRKQNSYNEQEKTQEIKNYHYNDRTELNINKETANRADSGIAASHMGLSEDNNESVYMQPEQENSTGNEKCLQQSEQYTIMQVESQTASQNKPSTMRSPRSSISKSGHKINSTNSTSQPVAAPLSTSSQSRSISGTQQVGGLQSITTTNSNSRMTTPRSSFHHTPDHSNSGERISKAGVIVTASSPRVTSRRSSTASAASAFAAATAASNNPILTQPPNSLRNLTTYNPQQTRKLSTDLSQRSGNNINFDPSIPGQLDSVQCNCASVHRGSIGSQANQSIGSNGIPQPPYKHVQKPGDINRSFNLSQNNHLSQFAHYPSCAYLQHINLVSPSNTPSNSYHAPPSEASSLCNSRASSRLSSCAGLDYSSYSSAQVNFYSSNPHQQFVAMNQATSSPTNYHKNQTPSRVMASNGVISISNQAMSANRSGSSTKSSKRNSSQINIRSVATIRVLSVLRHWVSKHSQDFVNDTKLSYLVQEFLQDLIMDTNLLPAEHKAALQLQQMVQKAAHARGAQVDLDLLLAPPSKPSTDSIETLSALEIAEGMTYLDHKIFLAIRSEEFLGQAWMKIDKAIKAPHILLITKRFNDVSRLVSSEIIRVPELHRRVAMIEKWTNVAHICRVVHNFNGVLQICAAFTNSAVFRLKKTWDKIPKTTKTTIDQLQSLVSTDSRFRNMRDAINRCDPPSIPYVGMYLTDLSFIEEGTPNYSPDGLLNFSKMRMIAHVIREIQHLQNGSYKIELNHRVANYLLDSSRHLQDDEMYRCSLAIEPRSSGGKNGVQILNSVSPSAQHNGPSPSSSSNQQISSSTNPPPPPPSTNSSVQNLSSSIIYTSNNNIGNNFSNNNTNSNQTTTT